MIDMKITNKGNMRVVVLVIIALAIGVAAYLFFGETSAKYVPTGDELVADFDKNGVDDRAFFLSQDTSTTTLFYVAAALNGAGETEPKFIGEKITPVNIENKDGKIAANYVEKDKLYVKIFSIVDGELVKEAKK